jgi:archaemetzincin
VTIVRQELQEFFKLPVQLLPQQQLTSRTMCPIRKRQKASMLLEQLRTLVPDSADGKVLALTVNDIEIEGGREPHWGVMGLANHIGGDACIVSTFRLAGKEERLQKVSLHELGHLMNLPHCTSGAAYCLMNDARGQGAVVDRTHKKLCQACRAQVKW